jgi:transcriptional regulator
LERLTAVHEAGSAHPWAMSDAPEDYLATMMKAVVAVELVVERLEGKWKLSQNRKPEDRDGVMRALAASDADVHRAALEEMGEG